jgi:5-methylcytosine-specific restriction endonuclease McrA
MYCCKGHKRKFWQKYEFFTAWRDIRRQAMRRDAWLCVNCLRRGKDVRAREVHHIIEIADGGDEFDLSNTESLCRKCHLGKTEENRALRKLMSAFANQETEQRKLLPANTLDF